MDAGAASISIFAFSFWNIENEWEAFWWICVNVRSAFSSFLRHKLICHKYRSCLLRQTLSLTLACYVFNSFPATLRTDLFAKCYSIRFSNFFSLFCRINDKLLFGLKIQKVRYRLSIPKLLTDPHRAQRVWYSNMHTHKSSPYMVTVLAAREIETKKTLSEKFSVSSWLKSIPYRRTQWDTTANSISMCAMQTREGDREKIVTFLIL